MTAATITRPTATTRPTIDTATAATTRPTTIDLGAPAARFVTEAAGRTVTLDLLRSQTNDAVASLALLDGNDPALLRRASALIAALSPIVALPGDRGANVVSAATVAVRELSHLQRRLAKVVSVTDADLTAASRAVANTVAAA